MTVKEFFTVAEAATLIAKVTEDDKFHVAKTISQRTRFNKILFYNSKGQTIEGETVQVLYGITSDVPGKGPLKFSDDPSFIERMDIKELLNCLGYHSSVQEKILNARPLIESATFQATPDPRKASEAAPVVADSASNKLVKKWTTEKLAELKAYRAVHTMPETAKEFEISEQRIRQLLPSNKPKPKGYSAFTHR